MFRFTIRDVQWLMSVVALGVRRTFCFRFSIRTLLIATAAAAAVLGVWTYRAERQRMLVSLVTDMGGSVEYRCEMDGASWLPTLVHKTALDTLGHDYTCDVVQIDLRDPLARKDARLGGYLRGVRGIKKLYLPGHKLTPNDCSVIGMLSDCEVLDLSGATVTRDLGESLRTMHSLRDLNLDNTNVDDKCMKTIGELHRLETLSLQNTSITDDGLVFLSSCSRLERLYLSGSGVSEGEAMRLRQSIPTCLITCSGQDGYEIALPPLKSIE